MGTQQVNIRDINPLEHLTADLSKARFNYESMLNGLVEWNNSKLKNVTVRLMCDTEPGFVDYTFPTKRSSEGNGGNIADPYSWENSYSYTQRYPVSAMISEDPMNNDKIDIRTTVNEAADSTWRLCASVVLYDEQYTVEQLVVDESTQVLHTSDDDNSTGNILTHDGTDATVDYIPGQFIRIYYPAEGRSELKWVSSAIKAGEAIIQSNTHNVVERWSLDRLNDYRQSDTMDYLFVVYDGKVYRPTGTISRSVPSSKSSGWEYYCDVYSDDGKLEHGKVYLYDPTGDANNYKYGEFFVYTGEDTAYAYPPYDLIAEDEQPVERNYNDGWENPSVILLPITPNFNKTNAVRWTTTTDIEALLLLRTGEGSADKVPDIEIRPNVRLIGGTTEDNGGLAIFDTANYAEWPGTTPKWSPGHNYSTDVTKGINDKQNYSATMIFDHANPNCKECNIVNYDGPDLDQGLIIYLPVESMQDDKIVYPKNGRTFEFLFRIWPNPAYNGHETADLIINKAQIYVYSVPSRNALNCHPAPIAKFSMARLTNFYVFSENIAVPNRPVLIKAKFVYSEEEQTWKTYDYYQLPDCIFLSPNGFVDPSRPSDETYGVETAGFPLVQDPFSNYDLSAVLVDDSFRNRIG
jgi:hypothetical protein